MTGTEMKKEAERQMRENIEHEHIGHLILALGNVANAVKDLAKAQSVLTQLEAKDTDTLMRNRSF